MKKNQKKNYWTQQEHDELFKLVNKYGLNNGCIKASKKFKRSLAACKSRYYNYTDEEWNKIEYSEPTLNQKQCAAYLAKEIQNNPLNLTECFTNTAHAFNRSVSYIKALYYEKKFVNSPVHKNNINGFYIVSNVTAHNAKNGNSTSYTEKHRTSFLLTLLNKLFNINGEN